MVRAARSLDRLLTQLNTLYPNRDKVSDGGIGDAAHAARESDHNPDANGVFHARDFTHDPVGGLDCNWLASQLVRHNDPRIRYIIWNHKYWAPGRNWVPYTGTNPHTHHLHLSVDYTPDGDNGRVWTLETEEPDMDKAEHDQLADVHYTSTNITQDGERVPLHVWAAKVDNKIDELLAIVKGLQS